MIFSLSAGESKNCQDLIYFIMIYMAKGIDKRYKQKLLSKLEFLSAWSNYLAVQIQTILIFLQLLVIFWKLNLWSNNFANFHTCYFLICLPWIFLSYFMCTVLLINQNYNDDYIFTWKILANELAEMSN